MSDVPSREELESVLGEITPVIYERYYEPYFEYLYSRDGVVIEEELFDQLSVDYSERTYRGYIQNIIKYDSSLEGKIAGRVYDIDAFIEQSAAQEGIDNIGQHINSIQQICLSEYRNSKREYARRLIHYHREKVEEAYSNHLSEECVDSSVVDSMLEEYADSIVDNVPKKVTSINQSGKNMSGAVNEALFYLALESAGLTRGKEFIDLSGGEDTGDIRVCSDSEQAKAFTIEAKSTGARERSPFGVSAVASPSGLIGFFDEPSEMVQQAESLESGCQVVYLPPFTLAKIAQKDEEVYTMTSTETGKLFFRANNEFGSDMKYYNEHGELPEKDIGHESAYLTTTWGSA